MHGTRALLLVVMTIVAALAAAAPGSGGRAEAVACTKQANPGNVQSVVNGSRSGDVICMAPGVYQGPIVFQGRSGVTLRGAGHKATIVAGGPKDGLLVFNSSDLVFEKFTLFYGHPANAYIHLSRNVRFQDMDVGGGGLGLHYDVSSTGRVSDSFIYAMKGDGVLIRRQSNVVVERNWVIDNGGVGVSTVGKTATTTITRNIISGNEGPGVFAGQTPCSLLPPGFVEVPDCYLRDLRSFVGEANIILLSNIIQHSGSTGIVMFPGTRGTFRSNGIWHNELSGLFVWGAVVSSEGDDYKGNEEHAIEFRAYPDPLKYGQVGKDFPVRAVGSINNNNINDSVVLAETGTLGGGVLAQGANLHVTNSRIFRNRGIGVSFVNTSLGSIVNNDIRDNRGSAICLHLAGSVSVRGNRISGNVDDRPGMCRETTP